MKVAVAAAKEISNFRKQSEELIAMVNELRIDTQQGPCLRPNKKKIAKK